MIDFSERLNMLTRKLYPTGLAWRMPKDGWLDSLHKGLAYSENRAYNHALQLLDSILPDNDGFTTEELS